MVGRVHFLETVDKSGGILAKAEHAQDFESWLEGPVFNGEAVEENIVVRTEVENVKGALGNAWRSPLAVKLGVQSPFDVVVEGYRVKAVLQIRAVKRRSTGTRVARIRKVVQRE